jgi:hypothetical protein
MSVIKKQIILGFAVILLGACFWYFLHYVFYVGNLTAGFWIAGGFLFLSWGISLCLAMLLIDDNKILYGSFLITLGLFGLFFNNEPFYYLAGLIILFATFCSASAMIKREEEIQVNLNFWRIWQRGLPRLLTALFIVVALVYFFSPHPAEIAKREITIPREIFNSFITPFENLIVERLPEGVNDLDAEAVNFLTPQQIQELKDKYNIEIKQDETMKDFIYKLVNYQLNAAPDPYKKFIPIGLAIALFLSLKIAGFIYLPFVILLSWLIMKILLALKFTRIERETKEVETVKL